MNTDPRALHTHVTRAVTAVLGLDGSNPWIARSVLAGAHEGLFVGSFDLREKLGDAGVGVVADALAAADTPAFRRAGWITTMDDVLIATQEAWLDPEAGETAALLADSPIVMVLIANRATQDVVLHIDASGWQDEGMDVAAQVFYPVREPAPTALAS